MCTSKEIASCMYLVQSLVGVPVIGGLGDPGLVSGIRHLPEHLQETVLKVVPRTRPKVAQSVGK